MQERSARRECYTPGMSLQPIRRPTPMVGRFTIVIALLILLFGAGTIAGYVIEYQWWQEMGQTETWFNMLWYGLAPVAAATVFAFVALFLSHARGMKFAHSSLKENRGYAKLSTLAL